MSNGEDNNKRNGRPNKNGVDSDYLDLLADVSRRDKNRDIYSDSSRRPSGAKRPDSSDDDVYITRKPKQPDQNAVYFSTHEPQRGGQNAGGQNRPNSGGQSRPRPDEQYRPRGEVQNRPRSDEQYRPRPEGQNRGASPQGRPTGSRGRNSDTGDVWIYDEPPRYGANSRSATPPPRRLSEDELKADDRRKKPKKKKHHIFLKIVALLLVLIIALGVYGYKSMNQVFSKLKSTAEIKHASGVETVSDKNVRNILLIGLDRSQGGASRSDSIIIASVNKTTGKITLTSIMRDSYVKVPGHGSSKINAAYAWGEAKLLIDTVELNFGIRIDDYALVDFDMFEKLVDGLGGINIEVTKSEAEYLNTFKDSKYLHFDSGKNIHMDGEHALWYARIRKLDSDFMRTYRQRKVLLAIAKKLKGELTPKGLPKLLKTAEKVAPYVTTTLSKSEIISMLPTVLSCYRKAGGDLSKLVVSQRIPFTGTWSFATIDGQSVVKLDLDKNKKILYDSVYQGKYTKESTES